MSDSEQWRMSEEIAKLREELAQTKLPSSLQASADTFNSLVHERNKLREENERLVEERQYWMKERETLLSSRTAEGARLRGLSERLDALQMKLCQALTEIAESDGIDAYRLTDIAAKALSPEEK